ncbi:SAM-dependent methyltransferase [Streptomonospora nanhaiensis]|uniref:O-methyltransferase involved in polyketide biosynthesis n=1 Tax=Streptomonospora nanhaiensis TaxID=1323731 RepID=A0A853BI62_9ACTN|nr:SAM-dependent methyltransferase [Streptomonospora nanhaiensis]MBV2364221.1 SAM-dependent methyltransferase [Streptomonospora nanhaiensis]MBX9386659.1 SAM-dependent methyltransferase [Streptomonospora nanhaiensis]NYI95178.1 O-methyltransferase involved in polyketide biosynthesis [Streptomonospora nanhaiensis]
MPTETPRPAVDTSVPHNARIWNYWLGGKDNYAVDREMGERIRSFFPEIVDNALADRAFLVRTVTHLVRDRGVRQFLDIGTGLPTHNNTHEVAQSLAPEARVVYVDNDPLVLAHARALLTGTPQGATAYVDADLRDPEAILAAAGATLDLTRPVALMLLGVVNFVADDAEVRAVLDRLLGALAPGSYLVVSHPTDDLDHERAHQVARAWNEQGTPKLTIRSAEAISALFDGLELLEPGVVSCSLWRPGPSDVGGLRPVAEYGGVARKP